MKQLTYLSPNELQGDRIKVSLVDIPDSFEPTDSLVEDDALRRSIEQFGVQQSIMVIPDGNRFTVAKGARRVIISRILGLDTIPAVVSVPPEGMDAEEYRNKLRMILTQGRQDLLPTQRAKLIRQLMNQFSLRQKAVAALLGLDAGSISNHLAIESYVPEIQRSIDTGELTPFACRAFDGMTPDGQRIVLKKKYRVLTESSGKVAHQDIRKSFPPDAFPKLYVAPEKTLEKLRRTKKGRQARHRPRLSKDDKDRLSRDLGLKEAELKYAKEELSLLKREISAVMPLAHAILRTPELTELVPAGLREELERVSEIY